MCASSLPTMLASSSSVCMRPCVRACVWVWVNGCVCEFVCGFVCVLFSRRVCVCASRACVRVRIVRVFMRAYTHASLHTNRAQRPAISALPKVCDTCTLCFYSFVPLFPCIGEVPCVLQHLCTVAAPVLLHAAQTWQGTRTAVQIPFCFYHTYKNVPLHPYYFLHSSAKKQVHIKCKAHARLYKYSSVFHKLKNVCTCEKQNCICTAVRVPCI